MLESLYKQALEEAGRLYENMVFTDERANELISTYRLIAGTSDIVRDIPEALSEMKREHASKIRNAFLAHIENLPGYGDWKDACAIADAYRAQMGAKSVSTDFSNPASSLEDMERNLEGIAGSFGGHDAEIFSPGGEWEDDREQDVCVPVEDPFAFLDEGINLDATAKAPSKSAIHEADVGVQSAPAPEPAPIPEPEVLNGPESVEMDEIPETPFPDAEPQKPEDAISGIPDESMPHSPEVPQEAYVEMEDAVSGDAEAMADVGSSAFESVVDVSKAEAVADVPVPSDEVVASVPPDVPSESGNPEIDGLASGDGEGIMEFDGPEGIVESENPVGETVESAEPESRSTEAPGKSGASGESSDAEPDAESSFVTEDTIDIYNEVTKRTDEERRRLATEQNSFVDGVRVNHEIGREETGNEPATMFYKGRPVTPEEYSRLVASELGEDFAEAPNAVAPSVAGNLENTIDVGHIAEPTFDIGPEREFEAKIAANGAVVENDDFDPIAQAGGGFLDSGPGFGGPEAADGEEPDFGSADEPIGGQVDVGEPDFAPADGRAGEPIGERIGVGEPDFGTAENPGDGPGDSVDAGEPDFGSVNDGVDVGEPDFGTPDVGEPDFGTRPESSETRDGDAGEPDFGSVDEPDFGSRDAGEPDFGNAAQSGSGDDYGIPEPGSDGIDALGDVEGLDGLADVGQFEKTFDAILDKTAEANPMSQKKEDGEAEAPEEKKKKRRWNFVDMLGGNVPKAKTTDF